MQNNFEKIEEYKFKNSISVRQNATQALIVLIGGVVGLCFTDNNFLKFFFIILGLFFIIVLMKNLSDAEATLTNICKQQKGK